MTRSRDNPLDVLLNVYFHQDWDVDADTADKILASFADSESKDVVRRARDEAAALVNSATTEEELDAVLTQRGLGYDPLADGLTNREWLQHVVERLSRDVADAQ